MFFIIHSYPLVSVISVKVINTSVCAKSVEHKKPILFKQEYNMPIINRRSNH